MGAWLVYGANGFTGRLVVERAIALGLRPIVAGRRENALGPWAFPLGLEYRVFDLEDAAALDAGLDGVDVVLHCAGPFSATSAPMLDACLRKRVHYLDLTGEYEVIEAIFARDAELRAAGIAAVPAVGFDVVPTDCMAAQLAAALPDATWLEMGILSQGAMSRGTGRTAVELLRVPGIARINGKLRTVKPAWRTREVTIDGKDRTFVSFQLADVSSAFHATRIPNVVMYMAIPPRFVGWLPWLETVQPWLTGAWVQRRMRAWVDKNLTGPDEETRASSVNRIWGRAEAPDGRLVIGRVQTPEGYRFTAIAAVAAVSYVLEHGVPPGAHTPSTAFGAHFVDGLEGVIVEPVERSVDEDSVSVSAVLPAARA